MITSLNSAVPVAETYHFSSNYLHVMDEGYGFLRKSPLTTSRDDIYVPPVFIKKFRLQNGDSLAGYARQSKDKNPSLVFVDRINERKPDEVTHLTPFEDLTPIFPQERIQMEHSGCDVAMRMIDLLCPIGKGQRGLIVSPPKTGKTTLLKQMAEAMILYDPEMYIYILLIDERPEEVTDIKESIVGDRIHVFASPFDETAEHHCRMSEFALGQAKRLVECQHDVVILVDSITRLTRAYNQIITPSGRTLSGGLDPAALYAPKKFFGAARNIREGGSLTIIATALVDTGSKMDDIVYEEFKGTGNMELMLSRFMQEQRIFPAIDIEKSGTRREDLLLTKLEINTVEKLRKMKDTGYSMFLKTHTNKEMLKKS